MACAKRDVGDLSGVVWHLRSSLRARLSDCRARPRLAHADPDVESTDVFVDSRLG